jgi:transposase
VLDEGNTLIIFARRAAISVTCPTCGKVSGRLHSRYQRTFADLPASGRSVHIRVTVRRFRCVVETCRTRIFAERLEEAIGGRYITPDGQADSNMFISLDWRSAAGQARVLRIASCCPSARTLC